MNSQVEYIFVKPSDKDLINAIHRILSRCGINMAKKFLFHWIPPYSKSAIRRDCESKFVVLVKDNVRNEYTSTFQMELVEDGYLYVGKIATDPKFEGTGIGKNNMLYMEAFATEKGCKSIKLDVYVKSNRAVVFYERNGFSIVGTKRSVRFREYVMIKEFKDYGR